MDEKKDFDEKTGDQLPEFEQMFGDAEQALRKSMGTLGEWGETARNIIQNRPGVVLASVSIAGFMTGLLFRQGGFSRSSKNAKRASLSADPLIVFLTGALAGITMGPRLLREAQQNSAAVGPSDMNSTNDDASDLGRSRRDSGTPPDVGHH
jgi:hypothetical protein